MLPIASYYIFRCKKNCLINVYIFQSRDGSEEDLTAPPSSTSFFGAPPVSVNQAQIEREQRLLERRLRQQQLQSEEDSRWLQQEETNLKKRLSNNGSSSFGSAEENSDSAPEPPTATARGAAGLDRDRSSTPVSSSTTDDRPIVVKVRRQH